MKPHWWRLALSLLGIHQRTGLCKIYLISNILLYTLRNGEPGSSVSIMSGYGLDDRAIEVRSPAQDKGFFL
jgi:hypothetical protein